MQPRPPAKFEFDMLEFLATRGGLSVREIFETFGKARAYTRGTIVKSIDRLHRKGLVTRELVDGSFVYRSVQGKDQLERQLVELFIRDRLQGRLTPIASFLAEDENLDPEEIKKLRELLDDLSR